MGTAGLGSVLELWLLGPDVVVEPGEKLAETRAAEEEKSEAVPLRCGPADRRRRMLPERWAASSLRARGERGGLKENS